MKASNKKKNIGVILAVICVIAIISGFLIVFFIMKNHETGEKTPELYDQSKIEQITGLELREYDTEFYNVECKEYYTGNVDNDYKYVTFYVFDDVFSAIKVYREIKKDWFYSITDQGDNYIQGWLSGVCDASIEGFVYISGNLIIYTDIEVIGEWESSEEDYSQSKSYVHDPAQFLQLVTSDFGN